MEGEGASDEVGGFACAGEFTDEECVGAEVGESVAEKEQRRDESELTEIRDSEAAGNDGNEEEGESLRGETGEEEVEGVAAEGSHVLPQSTRSSLRKYINFARFANFAVNIIFAGESRW
ncbi:MAG: hypothetical protein MHPDNHAH_02741 [Anaerolineales bacterium]|nr:hypothetical protein [Anaerolineales bacterium]